MNFKNPYKIFINSESSETSDPDRLVLNLTDEIDSKRSISLSNHSI